MKTKRKIHHIDPALQNRLLIVFVLLEVLLIGAGMIVLYLELKEIAEENLFRIHFAESEPLSTLLLREVMQTMAVLVILNLAALGLAEWWWSRYLASIMRPLSALLARTAALDFTGDEAPGQRHTALSLAVAWRENERAHCKAIRTRISGLEEQAGHATASPEQTRTTLENLKTLLQARKTR